MNFSSIFVNFTLGVEILVKEIFGNFMISYFNGGQLNNSVPVFRI